MGSPSSSARSCGSPSDVDVASSADASVLTGARDALRSALLSSRNRDGGWGYRSGKRSRVEPTCLALLALASEARDVRPVDASVLVRWERQGPLLIDPAATHPNLAFNAIAALVAQYAPLGVKNLAAPLATALLQYRGAKLPESSVIVQDNNLIGWPWLDGTFSWVEPTAWCLIALRRWSRTHPTLEGARRIDHAERLLRDRVCRQGGWNYGNSLVLGKPLMAYAATSALGLLALHNTPDDPIIARSIQTLHHLCATEQSGFALGLSVIAFRVLGRPALDVERTLVSLWRDSAFGGETVATALALYAINGEADAYEAFRA
jgi:hypothetical protein